ncbi:hypothetical protein BDQ94DRAFT_152621 [Aspergillus welwitschiae]|uniref:Uncharacterized protein n=1 Tax=Aspergillus welwitschiae TaxID=1341132 RepID=A0A3F3PMG5_9EURO|nr:hypothetical protein BDQ94DRAFT_152621 [Aspergillus welwitschiae]RDH28135.1 hypothetical protein BDQ94DRAFT_152621 [Aspergillus welwitschiae]
MLAEISMPCRSQETSTIVWKRCCIPPPLPALVSWSDSVPPGPEPNHPWLIGTATVD